MFRGSNYAFLQRLKTDEPEEIARLVAEQQERDARTVATMLVFMGAVF